MIALLATAALLGGISQDSTSFCLNGTMADGSHTRPRSVAHNGYALGTRLWVEPMVFGLHRWVVRDRIGHGTTIDFWARSCDQSRRYGRRTVRVHVGWRRPR